MFKKKYKNPFIFDILPNFVIMISEILKEKTSADHLMYVSLKYTKTGDVILNLIARWKSMIEVSFDALLEKALENKKISHGAGSPKEKIEFIKKVYKKFPEIQEAIKVYIFFKQIPELPKTREGEFRKNVALKVMRGSEEIRIDTDKLKEYSELLETFISKVKHLLSK